MFTQFFGNYLLNKGLVTTQQLSEAMAVQNETRPRLGVLAINAGYMTAEQVDTVHAEQQRVDKRIGDIAVDMGFLTRGQVEELLNTQGAAHLQLGQALVNADIMSNAQFADALSKYKEENSLTDVDFGSRSNTKINDLVNKFYKFNNESDNDYLIEYVTLLFKNIIRFIGSDFTPCALLSLDNASVEYAAAQELGEPINRMTIIEAMKKPYVSFASRYAEETLTEVDELTNASCGEFLNLHNGLFSVNISNERGTEIKIKPQEYFEGTTVSKKNFLIPIVFSFGCVNFIITK